MSLAESGSATDSSTDSSTKQNFHREATPEPLPGLTQEVLLHRITHRIRQSLELQSILSSTATEVRSFLGSDRVKIYQFQPDGHGLVIAESIYNDRLPALLGLHFPADDIPPYARELFVRARQRSIVDLPSHQIGISPLDCLETGDSLNSGDIRYRPVDPCHMEYLTAMGVKSSVVVPIVLETQTGGDSGLPSLRSSDQLWGLLVSHHAEARVVTEEELAFIQAVVDQVSIAIAQSILLERVRAQARQEGNINRITTLLHSTPTVQMQVALEEAVAVFSGSGGRLYLAAAQDRGVELYTCGSQPDRLDRGLGRPIEENRLWQKYLSSVTASPSNNGSKPGSKPWSIQWMRAVYALDGSQDVCADPDVWAIADLYREPLFRAIAPAFQSTQIRGVLVVPLQFGSAVVGCLTLFRDAIDDERMWAGYHNPDTRQLMPRQSFDAWKQLNTGQAQSWTEADLRLAQALGDRFASATNQYRLHQQVQDFNSSLEQQVQERTAELQQSNLELTWAIEQQEAIAGIVAKIRQLLDVETIFRTTTPEICQLLQVDRVAVYRFAEDWGGEFVNSYGSSSPTCVDVPRFSDNPIWNDSYLQETQGGRYRNNEVTVVSDVAQANFTHCHLEILEQFQIRAYVIVPIFAGEELWGLLGVYQHRDRRYWTSSEVGFVSQIATQLGVALRQSEYLKRVQAQAKRLAEVAEQQQSLNGVISKIRASLELSKIFEATTREVRQLLNVDRVVVFRFHLDPTVNGGNVVAENVLPEFPSTLAVQIPDRCNGEQVVGKYRRGYLHIVDDLQSANLDDCYVQMLTQLKIRANIAAPLFRGDQLWGLLCIHQCDRPRRWDTSEIEFVNQIAFQLGIALQHSTFLEQTRQQARQLSRALDHLKRTQSHLIHSEKMSSLGQLVAGVAHEINNPVNFIYGNLGHIHEYTETLLHLLQVYQQHCPEPPEIVQNQVRSADLEFIAEDMPKLFTSLKVGAERIREIVLSLRNFSRLDQADVKPVNLHEGIDSTLLILQHRLKPTSTQQVITVVKEYGELPKVECFASQINQVFMNLLSNAIDAVNDQRAPSPNRTPTIVVRTQRLNAHWVQISIKDNGNGISEQAQNRLFDPFFTTKPVGQGTGLGLSISHQIVEKHGGRLSCVSQPKQGAEFIVEIPVKQTAAG